MCSNINQRYVYADTVLLSIKKCAAKAAHKNVASTSVCATVHTIIGMTIKAYVFY